MIFKCDFCVSNQSVFLSIFLIFYLTSRQLRSLLATGPIVYLPVGSEPLALTVVE